MASSYKLVKDLASTVIILNLFLFLKQLGPELLSFKLQLIAHLGLDLGSNMVLLDGRICPPSLGVYPISKVFVRCKKHYATIKGDGLTYFRRAAPLPFCCEMFVEA